MKRPAIALAVIVALLLTGCAGTTDDAASEPHGLAQSVPSESPEPLVAETSAPAEVGTDAAYLEQLREALEGSGGNSIPDATDEQLIAAGHDACEQLAEGRTFDDIRVVEDEPMSPTGYKDSIRIAAAASVHFCPEFDPGA